MSAGEPFPLRPVFREPDETPVFESTPTVADSPIGPVLVPTFRPAVRPVDDHADGPDPLDRLVRCTCPLPCDRHPDDEAGRSR